MLEREMRFPYGISDFSEIRTEGYFYADRTDRIPLLERAKYLLFLRPRRFGKTLLLSTLAHYYDIALKDAYDTLFGSLAIGPNPTRLRNQYLILKWDFSCVDSFGQAEAMRQALHDHINSRIESFCAGYGSPFTERVRIDWSNAINSLESLRSTVLKSEIPVYLLIDEYDNFANQLMMGVRTDKVSVYEALVHEEGSLRTLFKVVKALAGESVFDRIFITGVSPVVMSDITSGYNIAENVYLRGAFNDLCGFTETEIESALEAMTAPPAGLAKTRVTEALDLMRTYYNGYTFSPEADRCVYNPTLSLYFLKYLDDEGVYPRQMLDTNLSIDEAKLDYIAQVSDGRQLLLDLLRGDRSVAVSELPDRFSIRYMLTDGSPDSALKTAFLYYFGVLTMSGVTDVGEIILKIPNLAIRGLYADRICEMLLPEPLERDDGKIAARRLYQTGDMQPLCDFIEKRYYKVFHNPDYRWANELTVKTAFLTLLYNDILYIMDSDAEIDRRYADLTMIIRPDMRTYKVFDILIEFKLVSLKEAGLTGKRAEALSFDELKSLPSMRTKMDEALKQVREYGKSLQQRYRNLRLRQYAVVSLGFDRIWWEEAR